MYRRIPHVEENNLSTTPRPSPLPESPATVVPFHYTQGLSLFMLQCEGMGIKLMEWGIVTL